MVTPWQLPTFSVIMAASFAHAKKMFSRKHEDVENVKILYKLF